MVWAFLLGVACVAMVVEHVYEWAILRLGSSTWPQYRTARLSTVMRVEAVFYAAVLVAIFQFRIIQSPNDWALYVVSGFHLAWHLWLSYVAKPRTLALAVGYPIDPAPTSSVSELVAYVLLARGLSPHDPSFHAFMSWCVAVADVVEVAFLALVWYECWIGL